MIKEEVKTRRTFAIISHPDAGKTTMTERLLLLGGAVRLAGSIKGRKTKRYAASDWMEMERQRGISITSSVLQFYYNGYRINILDTPGHQDFSEDTYRTLAAADSALMLIDMAKGVEPQTIKLFQVCRRQGIPIFTFINKLDRHGKDPFDLLDEIEKVLDIGSYPLNWPVNLVSGNYGLYDRNSQKIQMYKQGQIVELAFSNEPDNRYETLRHEIDLLDTAGEPFDRVKIANGDLTLVFFGSAINGFGIPDFFNTFLNLAPPPLSRKTVNGTVNPIDNDFSGFIFKVQANMNPAHRDRIAFLRICSGKFKRDIIATHMRTGKQVKLSQPQQFLAQDRHIAEEAYPGDIIGLYDPGIYRIGDTITKDNNLEYPKLPRFSPEHFARVNARNTLKYKQFHKGLSQLAEEGTIQVFHNLERTDIILGVVGKLQFEVLEYRLQMEYGVDITLHHLPYKIARWVKEPVPKIGNFLVEDDDGNKFILFKSEFSLDWVKKQNPDLELYSMEDRPLKY